MPNAVNSQFARNLTLPGSVSLVCCLILLILTIATATKAYSAWQAPLSNDEIIRATAIAMSDPPPGQQNPMGSSPQVGLDEFRRSTQANVRIAPAESHPLGSQILLIELKEEKNSSTPTVRLAEVFVFDYLRGIAELNLIDVEQNTLILKQEIPSVHLPLSDAEISYSKFLVSNNAELKRRIKDEIIATGQALPITSEQLLSELQTRVSIWVPNSPVQSGASNCDHERCALISLFTADHYNFAIEPVVNLMHGDIYTDLIK